MNQKFWIYIVNADSTGAYVYSGYKNHSEIPIRSINWIVIFHDKTQTQAYVSYLNSTFEPSQLKAMVNS